MKGTMLQKRLLALLLALTAVLLIGCGGQEQEKQEEREALPEELTQRLLSDWFDYLFACENLYGDMQWAASYIQDFGESADWDHLLRARMALHTAQQYIAQREKPEGTLTDQDYLACLDSGRDLSFVQPEIGGFAQDKQAELTRCALLETGLQSAVFTRREATALQEEAALYDALAACHLRYLAMATNYLLLEIDDPAQTEKFYSFIEENCPLLFAAWDGWVEDKDQALETASGALDEIEALRGQAAALNGRTQASLDMYRDAAASGDWSEVRENVAEISELPLVLPCPAWYDSQRAACYYYWTNDDGSRSIPGEREEIPRGADGCAISVSEVSQEDFLAYLDYLQVLGAAPFAQQEGTSYYDLAGSTFALTWEEGEAQFFMLERPVCLVPDWYFFYLLA